MYCCGACVFVCSCFELCVMRVCVGVSLCAFVLCCCVCIGVVVACCGCCFVLLCCGYCCFVFVFVCVDVVVCLV